MDKIKKVCQWCEELRPLVMFSMSLLCFVLFLYGVYTLHLWWIDKKPVVEYFGGEISPSIGRVDDRMIVHLNVRKLRNCPGVSQRRLTGECGEHLLSETTTYLNEGFSGRITIVFQIPQQVIPGNCVFQVHTRFICNVFDFIRERHFVSQDIFFRVLRYDE